MARKSEGALMPKCFAHRHMTCRQYGLWTRVRELQRKFGFIYFDGDDLAASFRDTKRDVIFRECKALVAARLRLSERAVLPAEPELLHAAPRGTGTRTRVPA